MCRTAARSRNTCKTISFAASSPPVPTRAAPVWASLSSKPWQKLTVERQSWRTLVLRSIGTRIKSPGGGKLFLEDVAGDELVVTGQTVFARQLNIENEGTHLLNDRSRLWILGYKTERGGTLIQTRGGGQTELLGGFSYTTTAGKLAPMFVNDNSSVFAYFHEVCYSGDPFQILIRETHAGETKEIPRTEGGTRPYLGLAKSLAK